MKFKLDFTFPPPAQPVSIRKPIVVAGSCFAVSVGNYLKSRCFTIGMNPSGILFNPLSIVESLESCIQQAAVADHEFVHHQNMWHSWKHHGSFSSPDRDQLLHDIVQARTQTHDLLKQADHLILTFGSAWVYELNENGMLVGNCHQVPSGKFTRRLLSVDEIVEAVSHLMNHEMMSGKNVVLTVSPVRYIRDGLINNNRSKAILLQAVHALCDRWPGFYYFPAYEMLIDELRDYRFYANDLVHPSESAVDYITQRFVETACDAETRQFLHDYEPIFKAQHHRPLHPDSESYKRFILEQEKALEKLKTTYNFLDISM